MTTQEESEDEKAGVKVWPERGVAQVTFGHGNVRMSLAHLDGEDFDSVLVLSEFSEAKPVGSVDDECPYRNKPITEIPKPRVELYFDNVVGIDALIASLSEVRLSMLQRPLPPAPEKKKEGEA